MPRSATAARGRVAVMGLVPMIAMGGYIGVGSPTLAATVRDPPDAGPESRAWPMVTSVAVRWILLLGLVVGGCAEPISQAAPSMWRRTRIPASKAEEDIRQCRQSVMSRAVINSKGLMVRRAMVDEEKFTACMRSRGYAWD